MDKAFAQKFYEREDIQKALLNYAKQREIGLRYDGYFGKRPEMMEYLSDVKSFVDSGVFSLHMSEERWENPLMLGNEKLSDEEKAKNRKGWDLILDIDGRDVKVSKIAARLIIDFLKNLGVKNVSLKFSGNKGFHIGVPFEAFSPEIMGIGETRLLFPEAPRRISSYLIYELAPGIAQGLLDTFGSVEKLAEAYGHKPEDLYSEDERSLHIDTMKIIELDTILISSRHLFRMPYSLHEKSDLVSIPLKEEHLEDFERFMAKVQHVKPEVMEKYAFLAYDSKHGKDADILLVKAYEDDYMDMISLNIASKVRDSNSIIEISETVDVKDFPQTIQYVLNAEFEDGRKRALFLLLTFLSSVNWKMETIEQVIDEWNKKQKSSLKAGYLKAQYSWFRAQNKKISPPNFDNPNYYEGIGIPKEIVEKDRKAFAKQTLKNPLQFVVLQLRKGPKGKK
jgi:hypothetical protein